MCFSSVCGWAGSASGGADSCARRTEIRKRPEHNLSMIGLDDFRRPEDTASLLIPELLADIRPELFENIKTGVDADAVAHVLEGALGIAFGVRVINVRD